MFLKKAVLFLFLALCLLAAFPVKTSAQAGCEVIPGGGGDANCAGTRICLPGVPKKLLPKIPNARPGYCGNKVDLIVMHTTHGSEQGAMDLWNYFAGGSRPASTQLVVGRDGSMLQMLDLFSDKSEVGHAVGGANDRSISIELNNPGNYSNKGEVPQAQYQNALKLVKTLMQTYNIPLSGVVSHGSLGGGAGDPGEGFLAQFKQDLPGAQALDGTVGFPVGTGDGTDTGSGSGGSASGVSCVITKVGDPQDPPPPLPPECTVNSSSGAPGIPSGLNGWCTLTGPIPSNPQAELKKYNVTLQGYDPQYAGYIYELFTCLSKSKFGSLVGAPTTIINASGPSGTYQMSCPGNGSCTVWMRGDLPENNFKHILTHEFGHVISATNSREALLKDNFANAFNTEGGLSPYSGGGNGCGGNGQEEDFAENVAYFFNPESGVATGACDNRSSFPNPLFDTPNFPLHLDVAKRTLL